MFQITQRIALGLLATVLLFASATAQTRKKTTTRSTTAKPAATPTATPTPQNAAEHGYRVGYEDGYIRGRSDFNDKKDRYPEDAAAYKTADRNYDSKMGKLVEFQSGYRAGFELGYEDGYFGRYYNNQTPVNLAVIVAVQTAPALANNATNQNSTITATNVPMRDANNSGVNSHGANDGRTRTIDPVGPAGAGGDIRNETQRNDSQRNERGNDTFGRGRDTRDPMRTASREPMLVPAGTQMKIRLQTAISSKDNREGDRFEAIVLDPLEYADARVTGYIAKLNKSGRMTGKTELVLAFESIELRNRQRGRFAAQVERVYESDSVKEVDDEGNVVSGSRTKDTAVRSGGGAVLGAIIGGIAGGGAGAAIGAAVGAAAGAGSVIYQGSKNVQLDPGTEMLIRTAAPDANNTNSTNNPNTPARTRN